MGTKAIYTLDTFKKTEFMYWTVSSQAGSKATIILRDDNKIYFTAKKLVEDWNLLTLEQGCARYDGGRNLRIEIEVYDHPEIFIKQSINSYNITTDTAVTVGSGFNICVEDHLDNDFNDYFISIVAWKKKG